jgi:thioredoxin 1
VTAGGDRGEGEPLRLTDADWDREVLARPTPILVDFWAPWCAPCRKVAPLVRALGARYAGRLRVASLDVDAHPRAAASHGVLSLPTLILFVAGEPVVRLTGAMSAHRLEDAVLPHLSEPEAA